MDAFKTRALAALAGLALLATPVFAADLRIGTNADPDILDPAQGGSVSGRVIFAAMCDKLIDTNSAGSFRPQLATDWSWAPDNLALTLHLRQGVLFQDGTALDAEAVKVNLERYRTDPISRRKNELAPVSGVEVIDPMTVKINLTLPYAPLIGVLADRAGMMMSPAALAKAGNDIGLNPVCAGPFQFVERVQQDHILLKRFPDYWDKDNIHLDTVTYLPIPDDNVRLLNLRSGDLDMIERVAPPDIPAVKAASDLKLIEGPSIAFDLISININHTDMANNPLGKSALVRQALALSIDRAAINQVIYEGLFVPNNQTELPGSTYYDADQPVAPRDVAKAKALLAEAGEPNPAFTLTVVNSPASQQLGQMIQAMAGEAGFKVTIQALESSTLAANSNSGNYQATLAIWSGRPDPDANLTPWAACEGFLNWGQYCNKDLDALLASARQSTDPATRTDLYKKVVAVFLNDAPQIVLYHYKAFWATHQNIEGYTPFPDGLIRLQGVTKTGS